MAMDFEKLQETDELMNEGVWMRLDDKGTMVKLRHTFSKAYSQARERAEQALRRRKAYRPERELDAEENLEVLREAVARGLIVDWKGFAREGDDRPFSIDEALLWLQMPTLVMRLLSMAAAEDAFEKENLEVLSGN